MYKITIKKIVDDVPTETIIESDDLTLIKEILVSEEILKVETDIPNQSIHPTWFELQEIWRKSQPPYKPLSTPPYIGDWPFSTPFTITC